MASVAEQPGTHLYLGPITSATPTFDLQKPVTGSGVWLDSYIVKRTPVTAGVPDAPTLSIDIANVSHNNTFHTWVRSDYRRGTPILLTGSYTAQNVQPAMHMHDGKIALEKFGLDIRDSTGAQ